jgi:NAD(P)-dependent dehydrogenase (short-subunit alcohol dehydrogenase family)
MALSATAFFPVACTSAAAWLGWGALESQRKRKHSMDQSKVAIVIAGGSGMGAAAARQLHQAGYALGIMSSSGKGEALAQELGGVGVTGSNQHVADMQKLVDAVMARYGKADEIGATVAFLASEGAAYITGQNIRVDGGLMRHV